MLANTRCMHCITPSGNNLFALSLQSLPLWDNQNLISKAVRSHNKIIQKTTANQSLMLLTSRCNTNRPFELQLCRYITASAKNGNGRPAWPHRRPSWPHRRPSWPHRQPAWPHRRPSWPHRRPSWPHRQPGHTDNQHTHKQLQIMQ